MLRRQILGQVRPILSQQNLALGPSSQQATFFIKSSFTRKGAPAKGVKKGPPKQGGGTSIYPFEETVSIFRGKMQNIPQLSEELPGTQTLSVETAFPAKGSPVSTVYRYSDYATRALLYLDSLKGPQKHRLFKNPASLIREESSSNIYNLLKTGSSSPSKFNRICITGEKGVGKSTALNQAHALALEQNYVVIHISRPLKFILGYYDAILAPRSTLSSSSRVFNQPMYVQRLMQKVAQANKAVLETIAPSKDYVFENVNASKSVKFTPTNSTLYTMLRSGKTHPEKCEIFNAVIEELANNPSVPVLLTMDDFNVFSHYPYSLNRDVQNKRIYHGELQVPKIFLDFFSGERTFKNGVVMAALSSYKDGYTIPHGLGLSEPDPYAKFKDYDPILAGKMRANGGVKPLEIKPFSFNETATLIQYYKNGGFISDEVTDSLIQQKYFLSGNGNPLGLFRTCFEQF